MTRLRFATTALAVALIAWPSAGLAAEVSGQARRVPAKRSPAHAGPMVLPFIEDDYPRALEVARQRKLPIFIEAWAPW